MMMANDGIKNALMSLKMMVSKKEQSIKLLLVIVKQKRLYFAHPQHYFST